MMRGVHLTGVLGFPPMPSRALILVLALFSIASFCRAGEIVMLKCITPEAEVATMTIAAGESAKLLSVFNRGSTTNPTRLFITMDGQEFNLSLFDIPGSAGFTITGPATIKLDRPYNITTTFAAIEVTRAPELTPAIPAAAVVIPEDAQGQFQVLLESTTDGVNWSLAQPGLYGGSTVKRFFRTRILKTN